jgi:hypothetical protein
MAAPEFQSTLLHAKVARKARRLSNGDREPPIWVAVVAITGGGRQAFGVGIGDTKDDAVHAARLESAIRLKGLVQK